MLTHYSFAILQLTGFFHHCHRSMTLRGLLSRPDAVVYGAFACCCAGSVDGYSGPGVGFLLSSSGRGLLVGDALVFAGLGTSRMWTLFHLSSCPWGVVSRYDIGSSHFSRTVDSLHSLVWWSCKRTGCPVARCGRSLACWSWCILRVDGRFYSSWRMLSSGCGLVSFVGMFDMAFLPVRISMGLGKLDEIGVMRRHNRARSGSVSACWALVKVALTVWTWRSMKPLDLG